MNAERMTEAHLDGVAALEGEIFSEPWSCDALRLLLTEDAIGFVCTEGETVAAYGGMLLTPFEGQVTNIAVHPSFRRRGLGGAILRAMKKEATARGLEQISLEVRASNEPAIALYLGYGFYEAGLRRRFYKNPSEDAKIMLLPLTEEE
jgi:ribosomal-protein-alanine N-acetyltransferase